MAATMRLSGLLLLLLPSICHAFLSSSAKLQAPSRQVVVQNTFHNPCHHELRQITSLNGGLFGGKTENNEEPPGSQTDPSVPTRVLEIPVSSLKKGGLRFTLGLHLVGLQDKGTWRPNQASDNVIEMYFKDQSAMFSLVLEDDAIRVDRYGKPSLAYVLQESVVLHSVLAELKALAFEGEIEDASRLLQLEEPRDAIEKAIATLPARKA
mmetsp:Transcript_14679/g.31901  ORF Transcript_14679/g.31901 Transcript_14679/m.31901 type:complete len:209 (+) Transcript_14679:85-711(+)|eukprot:CAMPEP_0172315438 /NCGR_PEP_ID=MMETSP1058-20130122/25191_1 /TAXON_ID=83371 /ORGANISM="Detonula confervacea, Strain CCMP 353" /LENGTH=208 /DNA_ID=CAMNT_0013029515 /DNA_START=49 /DNA_END=675 /DNA_ORIENTATION=-